MRRRNWVLVLLLILVAGVVLYSFTFRYTGETKADRALLKMQAIHRACENYRKETGSYPTTLTDLVKPPDGEEPFLEDGQRGIIDSWGNPFKYEIVTNENGAQIVYVWAEQTKNGKVLTVVGEKPGSSWWTRTFGP